MKKKSKKIRFILFAFAVFVLSINYSLAQKKNTKQECKYSVNKIDEFSKEKDVRTKFEEFFYNKEIAPPSSSGDGLWCRKTILVCACNIGGENYLLIRVNDCNCDYGSVSSIYLLLENENVIALNNKIENDYNNNECDLFWQFNLLNDDVWHELKTNNVKKIRISYNYKKQYTYVIEDRNKDVISKHIACIDRLDIAKQKEIKHNVDTLDKDISIIKSNVPKPLNDTLSVSLYKQWKQITTLNSEGIPKEVKSTTFLNLNADGTYEITNILVDGKVLNHKGSYQIMDNNKIIVFKQENTINSYSSLIIKFTNKELILKSENHQTYYMAY